MTLEHVAAITAGALGVLVTLLWLVAAIHRMRSDLLTGALLGAAALATLGCFALFPLLYEALLLGARDIVGDGDWRAHSRRLDLIVVSALILRTFAITALFLAMVALWRRASTQEGHG